MSEKKKSVAQILHQNRNFVLTMLGVPVFGMALAFVIIYWKKPDNMIMVLAVIFFLSVQYVIMMFFLMKRIEILSERDEEKDAEEANKSPSEVDQYASGENVLKPEEERVFPTDEET